MTLALPHQLPALDHLRAEGLKVTDNRLFATETRPVLRIGLVNLMPDKITTETQFARQLARTGKEIELVLPRPQSYACRNTSADYLTAFYQKLEDMRHENLDGVIVTGAPVETLAFSEVDYWHELTQMFDHLRENRTPALFICWAAQAALHRYHGIPKHPLAAKASGVFQHRVFRHGSPCVSGMGTQFPCPVSRRTAVRWADLSHVPTLHVAAASDETGVGLAEDPTSCALFMFNHLEYAANTLAREYQRDLQADPAVQIPANYFSNDDPTGPPVALWMASAHRFFSNWVAIVAQRRSSTLTVGDYTP